MIAIELNLLPYEFQTAQMRRRHVRTWATAILPVVAILIGLTVMDGVRRVQAQELRDESQQLDIQLAAARAEVRNLTGSVGDATLQLQRSDALRGKRSWSGLMTVLGQCLPQVCWLESVATDPDLPSSAAPPTTPVAGVAKETTTITIDAPRKLRLVGLSRDASGPLSFASNLKQAAVFKTVTLERSVRDSEDEPARFRFEIVCEW